MLCFSETPGTYACSVRQWIRVNRLRVAPLHVLFMCVHGRRQSSLSHPAFTMVVRYGLMRQCITKSHLIDSMYWGLPSLHCSGTSDLVVVPKATKRIWKTSIDRVFPVVITWLLKTIHRSCFRQFQYCCAEGLLLIAMNERLLNDHI